MLLHVSWQRILYIQMHPDKQYPSYSQLALPLFPLTTAYRKIFQILPHILHTTYLSRPFSLTASWEESKPCFAAISGTNSKWQYPVSYIAHSFNFFRARIYCILWFLLLSYQIPFRFLLTLQRANCNSIQHDPTPCPSIITLFKSPETWMMQVKSSHIK